MGACVCAMGSNLNTCPFWKFHKSSSRCLDRFYHALHPPKGSIMPVPEKCNNVKCYNFPCILISRFSYAENLLYFSLADFPVNLIRQIKTNILLPKFLSYYCLHFTKNIVYHILEILIFYADKVSAMGHYRHSRVFNFVNVLKSQKLDAHKNSRLQ